MTDNKRRNIFCCLLITAILLLVILLPLSLAYGKKKINLSHFPLCLFPPLIVGLTALGPLLLFSSGVVEYYEYGLDQRKTTGSVNTEKVYSR